MATQKKFGEVVTSMGKKTGDNSPRLNPQMQTSKSSGATVKPSGVFPQEKPMSMPRFNPK